MTPLIYTDPPSDPSEIVPFPGSLYKKINIGFFKTQCFSLANALVYKICKNKELLMISFWAIAIYVEIRWPPWFTLIPLWSKAGTTWKMTYSYSCALDQGKKYNYDLLIHFFHQSCLMAQSKNHIAHIQHQNHDFLTPF